jgi:hypothetical protein
MGIRLIFLNLLGDDGEHISVNPYRIGFAGGVLPRNSPSL